MASLLYRLGQFSFRRRRLVLPLWALALVLMALGAVTLSGATSSAFSIPGTESSKALEVISAKMGGNADAAGAKVVFTVTGDATLTGPAQKAAVEKAVAALRTAPQVATVADPYQSKTISPDGRTAYATVTYPVAASDLTDSAKQDLITAGRTGQTAGVRVEFGGDATQPAAAGGATEIVGVLVAGVVLAITFGALVAAGLPLLTAFMGVGVGMLGIQIATGFFDLSSSTSALATMLGLAVGIDYALFIVSRYRHELTEGYQGEEAAGRAVGTAGSAVVFAGLTVIIALSALAVVGIPFLAAMGFAAAGTVAVAVLISLTLLPALLGFAGRRILPKALRGDSGPQERPARTPFGERWARGVVKHRVLAVLLPVAALAIAAIPTLDLRLGLPDDSTAAPASTQRMAYDQLSAGFGAGFNGPLIIVVQAADGQAGTAATQAKNVIAGLPDVVTVTPPTPNRTGDTAILSVIPKSGPGSADTKALVHAIRARQKDFTSSTGGATLAVTGTAALNIDVAEKTGGALLPYLAVIVGLAFILLMLVFRSILVPIKATAGFLLSVAATFGAVVAVFQWGWLADLLGVDSTGPIVSFIPIFLIGILFGLAMDYELFLVTRVREEYAHGATPNDAVISGVKHGARVVTAAALIMISVFAGFILTDDAIVKSLGFALAFGVLVDAFLVRMTIVPAVLSLLGKAAWALPRWLDKALPNLDIEGEKLIHQTAGPDREQDRQPHHEDQLTAA
jgi:RND superfamily putative drug exporter